jgi:integrase
MASHSTAGERRPTLKPKSCAFRASAVFHRPQNIFGSWDCGLRRSKTAALLGASTGLRVGEILGPKWEDVDFENHELRMTRDVVKQRIEHCKTEESRKPVPIDAAVAEILWAWRLRCAYDQPKDWIFANPVKKGSQPY